MRAQRCSHVAEQSGGGTTCRFHGAWNAHVMHIIPFAYISLPSSNTKKDSWKRGHTSASIFYPASLKKAKHASHSSFYKGPKSPFSPPSHISFANLFRSTTSASNSGKDRLPFAMLTDYCLRWYPNSTFSQMRERGRLLLYHSVMLCHAMPCHDAHPGRCRIDISIIIITMTTSKAATQRT